MFDGERAAKAAALVSRGERADVEAVDLCEQLRGLVHESELAQVTGGVDGGGRVVARAEGSKIDTEDAREELDEFVGLGGQCIGTGGVGRIVGEQVRDVKTDHGGARAGGCHDRVEWLEDIDGAVGEDASVGVVTGVEHRLAAAGLGVWELDMATQMLKDQGRGDACPRGELLCEAGDEECDVHGLQFGLWFAGGRFCQQPVSRV